MPNNFSSYFPVVVHPALLPILHAKRKDKGDKFFPLDHTPRPYRVLLTNDELTITEWMVHRDGTINRTPMGVLRSEFLEKDNTKAFLLQGGKGQYVLQKDGRFRIPLHREPIQIFVNKIPQLFDDVYPDLKYYIQAKSCGGISGKTGVGTTTNQFVGLGWRKEIETPSLSNVKQIDLSVSLVVSAREDRVSWKVIASQVGNEKYKYETSISVHSNTRDVLIEIHE